MKKETDLRVQKTLGNIRESMMELLRKKTVSDITVKEICHGARCSRNTFYLHYPYKEALYEEILDDCIDKVQSGFTNLIKAADETDEEYTKRCVHSFIVALYEAKPMLEIILHSDSTNTFCCRLTNAVREALLGESARLSKSAAESETYKLIARYCSSGIVGFFLGWFEDTRLSIADAEKILLALHSSPFILGLDYLQGKLADKTPERGD